MSFRHELQHSGSSLCLQPDSLPADFGLARLLVLWTSSLKSIYLSDSLYFSPCVCVCVCIQKYVWVSKSKLNSSSVLGRSWNKIWYPLGRKLSKGYKFQIQVYNQWNKILSKPKYTPFIIISPGQFTILSKSITILKKRSPDLLGIHEFPDKSHRISELTRYSLIKMW